MSYLYNHHGKVHEMRTDASWPQYHVLRVFKNFLVVYALVVAIIDRFTFICEVIV